MAPSGDSPAANTREDSWELPNPEHTRGGKEADQESLVERNEERDGESSDDPMMSSPDALTAGDVEEAFHPLRTVADRVGYQVELFAETLDKYNIKKRQHKRVDHQRVFELVGEYKRIALDTVKRLEKYHGPELRERLNGHQGSQDGQQSRHMNIQDEHTDLGYHGLQTSVEDLQRWQLEAQTWGLLDGLLKARYRGSVVEVQAAEKKAIELPRKIHRYSSESEVWTRFLAGNDLAWERHTILNWLMGCADTTGQDIDTIIEHLESDADRGTGLWAHGWLYTKEAIKGQKRLRSWPQVLEPTSPGIGSTHLSLDKTETLVTQLDPDATTRQGCTLERQDEYFENATWLACWEMIRRGKSWDKLREWCQERVEAWRALSLRAPSAQSTAVQLSNSFQPTTRATGSVQSGPLWRRMCYAAANNTSISIYESAVYGVLSGDIETVEEVCRSWDDFVFAYYNALLLHQFDTYLQSEHPNRLPTSLLKQFNAPSCAIFYDEPGSVGRVLVDKLKTNTKTKLEAQNPLKMIQGCLIANTFDEFVFRQGLALSSVAKAKGKSAIIPPSNSTVQPDSSSAAITFEDYDSLRVLTHMIFLFQDLGIDFRRSVHCADIENIVVAYIDFLKLAGKTGTLPLYASRLSKKRTALCLGRELNDILVPQERKMLTELMKQLRIDVGMVLRTQMQLIFSDISSSQKARQRAEPFRILENHATDPQMLRPIKKDFIGKDISDHEHALLRCLEWYLVLEGRWDVTSLTGVTIYMQFLTSKRLAAARALSKKVPFSRLSTEKTASILGKKIDVSTNLESSDDAENEGLGSSRVTRLREKQMLLRRRRSSSAQRSRAKRNYLLSVSKTFIEFEQLVVALDALETWANVADQVRSTTDPPGLKKLKPPLIDATDKVVAAVEPLLSGWLVTPVTEDDDETEEEIRKAYLPEVVLAYVSVLHFAGYAISRDLLLRCMDLGATVAAPDSDVAACFMSVGRMSELVDALAFTSKSILRANEQGSKTNKGRKKTRHGQTLDLWTVKSS